MKIECIVDVDTISYYHVTRSQLSDSSAIFEAGSTYEGDVKAWLTVNNRGEAVVETEAEVYDGSVDGYDSPCGIRFTDFSEFNQYFKVIEK